jgi:hypothetical protein
LSLLAGCREDEVKNKTQAQAQKAPKVVTATFKFGRLSADNILRDIMLLKQDDRDGMARAIHKHAGGFCTKGKRGAGINQLLVAGSVTPERAEQSKTFAMKDALQDAMHPLEGRYRAEKVKTLFSGTVRLNDQTYIRTIILACFSKVAAKTAALQKPVNRPGD